jgi:hypothetical protein
MFILPENFYRLIKEQYLKQYTSFRKPREEINQINPTD